MTTTKAGIFNPGSVDTTALADLSVTPAKLAAAVRAILPTSVVVLTDAATIATDASLGSTFDVTIGGNRTMGAPTNPTDGQRCLWRIKQDATGSRTITWASAFDWGTGGAPTLTLTAGKTDLCGGSYNAASAKWQMVPASLGYA